ncbi:carboxymuconolactone decarboxylase family protein [Vibrio olivae]|uniref:Carboxymuconolactone decarboxylase family protein n=1 Tax=Vibrio olivae TaxID=1243002 RepID=A0ABV5HSV8_9VIBR
MQTEFSEKQLAIIPISAFTASGNIEKLKTSLNEGLDAGLSINEVKEVLVQLYAYAGFPRSLNGIGTLMSVVEERKQRGIEDDQGKDASPFPTDKTSLEFGTDNQTKLVGQAVAGPMFDFCPEIDHFLKAHLFGDIFERDVLSWQDRELATIAALANIDGVNSQLGSHIGISLNNGINPTLLEQFIGSLRKHCGDDIADNANQVLQNVLS